MNLLIPVIDAALDHLCVRERELMLQILRDILFYDGLIDLKATN